MILINLPKSLQGVHGANLSRATIDPGASSPRPDQAVTMLFVNRLLAQFWIET